MAQSNPLQYNLIPSLGMIKPTLGLTQIDGFAPIQSFVDSGNTTWQLIKAFTDSTMDIPDPKQLQITNYWNHEFLGGAGSTKLYVYVVEGLRQPRIETERPTMIMYQWFCTQFIPAFTPQMISEREWLRANVYAAQILDTRMSKLRAFCHAAAGAPDEGDVDLIKLGGK